MRTPGKSRQRREDNVKIGIKSYGEDVDFKLWTGISKQALANTAMNLWVL
jgi:hypothetical protein